MKRLRLASYNIHKCVGVDRRRQPHRITAVLNEVAADVVALQEVDYRMGRRPAALPATMLAKETDYTTLPFSLEDDGLGWHGQTILLRNGLEASRIERLNLPGLEPRGAVLAELTGPSGRLRVVGVHLGLIRRYRLLQMAAIRNALARRPALPTVILGDFNEWSARGGVAPLADAFHVHAPGLTYHASHPVAALDRIAVGKGVHLTDAGVTDTRLSRLASDHLPVWADLHIGEEPRRR